MWEHAACLEKALKLAQLEMELSLLRQFLSQSHQPACYVDVVLQTQCLLICPTLMPAQHLKVCPHCVFASIPSSPVCPLSLASVQIRSSFPFHLLAESCKTLHVEGMACHEMQQATSLHCQWPFHTAKEVALPDKEIKSKHLQPAGSGLPDWSCHLTR